MPTVVELTGSPAVYDFDVTQGAVFSRLLTWKDEDGDPIDNSTYTARMQVRRKVDSEDVIVTLATADDPTAEGLITLGGADGTILLFLDASETAALPATPFDRKWRYDIEMVPADAGEARRLMMGRFKVSLEVTR